MADDSALLAPVSVAPQPPAVPSNANADAAHKAGQDFEAFFLSQAFENMFSGIDSDPLFGGGNGESVYRSLLLQEYSKVAAKSGVTGIGDEVTREILRMQETQGKK
ncbi:MAG TPA: rod-binding protein [Stellaceae bacterium]|nr:rod-binding protein [Stellaceae bacterium]